MREESEWLIVDFSSWNENRMHPKLWFLINNQPAKINKFFSMPLIFHKKPALVVYVTCGDPDLATTREIVLAAIEAGADVIELGVPFSDPMADGPVIQRASDRAIRQGRHGLSRPRAVGRERRDDAQRPRRQRPFDDLQQRSHRGARARQHAGAGGRQSSFRDRAAGKPWRPCAGGFSEAR